MSKRNRERASPASRIEMLCIGDELLDGRTSDKNAAWFGGRLAREGLSLARVRIVPDQLPEIGEALTDATAEARYVLVSGGLGPTEDDRTREAAAAWMRVGLVEDAAVLQSLKDRFAKMGREFHPTNRRQASFPDGAEVLATEVGTAAGFRLQIAGCTVDFVPGVPHECRWFVERHALPRLRDVDAEEVASRSWTFFGLGESDVAQRLDGLDPPGASIHYTPRFPEVRVFIRVTGADALGRLEAIETAVLQRLGTNLVARDEETLVGRVAEHLTERGLRLATAESCTGGQLGYQLTSVSGSSAYFLEGFVTYTNTAKIARLGVPEQVIEAHGAVSSQTAARMAEGVKSRTAADIGLSITGIAGPTGGSAHKPVGTVFLGFALPDGVYTRRLDLGARGRQAIRTLSTWSSLSSLLWYLEGRLPPDFLVPSV